MSPRARVLLLGIAVYLLAAWLFSGCSATMPIGEGGRYGYVRCQLNYLPPVDLWSPQAKFLPDK